MSSDPQITELLNQAQAGDEDAITRLFEYYYPRLVRYAQRQIVGSPQQMAGADDVAASAVRSFYKAAEAGRFPNLKDRQSLWRLLAKMTFRKAVDHRRRETCEKRGGGNVQNEPAASDASDASPGLAQLAHHNDTPELEALMLESCEERLKILKPELQDLALVKLEGCTNREAGERLGMTERAVEYGLKTIRKKWTELEARESGTFSKKSEKERGKPA